MLPAFLVRKYDAGVNVTPADQEAWEWFQALFFAPVQPAQKTKAQRLEERAKARAKGKAKGKGRAGGPMRRITDVPRMASHRTLLALDATLQRATGQGLSYFSASSGTDALPHLRPTLTMHLDEGSVGYGACWYCHFHILTRMVVCRDIYHREWNLSLIHI